MKLKTFHAVSLAAVIFTVGSSFDTLAQEGRATLDEENASKEFSKQDQETLSGSENPEIRAKNPSSTPVATENIVGRDSEAKNSRPLPKAIEKSQKEEEKVAKEEEDPLSFNFLYYIIEKFKLSDIVE